MTDSDPSELQIADLQRQLREHQTSAERARLLGDLDEAETKFAKSEYEHAQFMQILYVAANESDVSFGERYLKFDGLLPQVPLAVAAA